MLHIDPATLSTEQARAYLAVEAASLERAEIGVIFSVGSQRKRYAQYVQQHKANVMALADIAYPISDDSRAELLAMSDADLLRELGA